jgi:tRNA-2-methylthio-N6-dimethylallyladenosine synthase
MSYRKRFFIETWGCQMNVLDTERMAGVLRQRGFEPSATIEDSDVILLNTCSVREKAEDKAYSELGRLNEWKRSGQGRVIGVTGCVAQQEGTAILERAPSVDFVLGTGQVERVAEAVERAVSDRIAQAYLDLPADAPEYQFRSISRNSTFQAYVTVIEGCNMFCTFCVVPFTRGRERSRRLAEIVDEVGHLVRNGYSEVTLLGQTVNAYRDPDGRGDFASLLDRVSQVPGLRRLRFVTSHPRYVSDRLIEVLASRDNLAPYFHLPAQSGSDAVLDRMKRRYTRAEYLATVGRVRARIPDIALSSDFIVGFPGETEADFQASLDLVREARFAMLYAFRYSARPGTAAARWGSEREVPDDVACERLERLLALQRSLQREQNRALEGSSFEVLVDSESRMGGQWSGRTPCNRVVNLEADSGFPMRAGQYVRARILRGRAHSLLGRVEAIV